jgi:ABC-type phosphate transport system permease subunit
MNRKIGVILFVFICFLIWLYFAIYESSIHSWWTVNEIKQASDDTVQRGVSFVKVLVGTVVFILSGIVIYFMLRKRN